MNLAAAFHSARYSFTLIFEFHSVFFLFSFFCVSPSSTGARFPCFSLFQVWKTFMMTNDFRASMRRARARVTLEEIYNRHGQLCIYIEAQMKMSVGAPITQQHRGQIIKFYDQGQHFSTFQTARHKRVSVQVSNGLETSMKTAQVARREHARLPLHLKSCTVHCEPRTSGQHVAAQCSARHNATLLTGCNRCGAPKPLQRRLTCKY